MYVYTYTSSIIHVCVHIYLLIPVYIYIKHLTINIFLYVCMHVLLFLFTCIHMYVKCKYEHINTHILDSGNFFAGCLHLLTVMC